MPRFESGVCLEGYRATCTGYVLRATCYVLLARATATLSYVYVHGYMHMLRAPRNRTPHAMRGFRLDLPPG